jgi:hypothetical protein
MLKQIQSFDLVAKSAIVRSDKPTKGLDAHAAATQQQMNRVSGFLLEGAPIVVAQRPGKGGMDFNKLVGGKVFAVGVDGFSPVFTKDAEGEPTKTQKMENGLPLYSTSGFYLLSSKEYPALDLFEAYALLLDRGQHVLLVSTDQLAARETMTLADELDLDVLQGQLMALLDDAHNRVAVFDAPSNLKRKRGIARAKEEAEDAGEPYAGVAFKELAVSPKDGNPAVVLSYRLPSGEMRSTHVIRQSEEQGDRGPVLVFYTAEEAVTRFADSRAYRDIESVVNAGESVEVGFVQGHLLRTSVSFRRKAENILALPADKRRYGDAVFVDGALAGWTRAQVAVMFSQHPNFPAQDYDSHHYVVALRQAEIGMNKKPEGGWQAPKAVHYDLPQTLLQAK